MFGTRYFGRRYFAGRYFGPGAGTVVGTIARIAIRFAAMRGASDTTAPDGTARIAARSGTTQNAARKGAGASDAGNGFIRARAVR